MEGVNYLFIITFVFGTILLFTTTVLFRGELKLPLNIIFMLDSCRRVKVKVFLSYLDRLILYFSICYQTWFWMSYLQ